MLCGISAAVLLRHRVTKEEEVSWKIDGKEIILSNEILGRGENGDVIKAQYRGTTVAIKNILFDWEARRGSVQEFGSQSVAVDSLACRGDVTEIISLPDSDCASPREAENEACQSGHTNPSLASAVAASFISSDRHSYFKRRSSSARITIRRASISTVGVESRPPVSLPDLKICAVSSAPNTPQATDDIQGGSDDPASGCLARQPSAARGRKGSILMWRRGSLFSGGGRESTSQSVTDETLAPVGSWRRSGSFIMRHGSGSQTPTTPTAASSTWRRAGWGMVNSWLDSNLSRTSLQNEIKALVAIRHPCITTIMGATVLKLQGQKRLCLVVELMELGSLWDLLHNETFILRGKQVRGRRGRS